MEQTNHYPFDVLGSGDFKDKVEQLQPTFDERDNKMLLSIKFPDYLLSEEPFADIYVKHEEALDFVMEFSCSATMVRKIFKANAELVIKAEIDKELISGAHSLSFFVLTNQEIEFDSMVYDKGMPLIIFPKTNLLDRDDWTGLINFRKVEEEDISYHYTNHQIGVHIPKELYEQIEDKRQSPLVKQALASQLGQIALLEAVHIWALEKKENNSSKDHFNWFKGLEKYWSVVSNGDEEYPQDEKMRLEFVNEILKSPSLSYFKQLVNRSN